jgi:hypothetical protein
VTAQLEGANVSVMTADRKTVAEGNRVFNFYDWKWGVIVRGAEGMAELAHDDGTCTVINSRWVLTKDPSRLTW